MSAAWAKVMTARQAVTAGVALAEELLDAGLEAHADEDDEIGAVEVGESARRDFVAVLADAGGDEDVEGAAGWEHRLDEALERRDADDGGDGLGGGDRLGLGGGDGGGCGGARVGWNASEGGDSRRGGR